MIYNTYYNDGNFDLPLHDCDESIASLALSDMGSLAPSMMGRRISAKQHQTKSTKKTLQNHFSHGASRRKDSIGGISSAMSFDDDDDDDDDDNFTYTTSASSRLLSSNGQKQQHYNETDLTNIMMKLRGDNRNAKSTDIVADEEKNEFDEEADLSDDLISRHLRALTITTSTKRVTGKSTRDTAHQPDDVSVMTYGTELLGLGCSNDDDDDNEDDDEESDSDDSADDNNTAYDEVDDVMNRLNSMICSSTKDVVTPSSKVSGRELLQQMSKQGACDYESAPQDASSKKEWLARLAAELLQEEAENEINMNNGKVDTNSDDDDAASVAMSVVEIYNRNVRLLEKEAERATKLLYAVVPPKPQPLKHDNSQNKLLIYEKQYRVTKPLKSSLKQFPDKSESECTPKSLSVATKDTEPTLKLIIARSTTKASKKLSVSVKDEESPIKPIIERSNARSKLRATSSPSHVVVQPVSKDKITATTEAPSSTAEVPLSSSSIVNNVKKSSFERQFQFSSVTSKKDTTPSEIKAYANIVIPSGFPPYPGHGTKWPWHPDSPRAPNGYTECYMLHMGENYHRYMTYLQQRATNGTDSYNNKSDEVLRYALSSHATLKDHPATTKSTTKPTTSPATTAPCKPPCGRARKNCVVPVVLAKIEEGSNSSSSSSSDYGSKTARTVGAPDPNVVGKVHPKSKGKRGSIVVVTANEVDQQAKEQRKVQRQQQQTKKSTHVDVENVSKKTQTKVSKQNENHNRTTTKQQKDTIKVDTMNQCACTIM